MTSTTGLELEVVVVVFKMLVIIISRSKYVPKDTVLFF